MESQDLPAATDAAATPVRRADRILVWLVGLTLLLGGLATMAVAFSAEAVLARLNAIGQNQPAADEHDAGEGASDHDMGGMHDATPTADMPGHDMGEMHDATPTGDTPGHDMGGMHDATAAPTAVP